MVVTGNDMEETKALQEYLFREFEMKDLDPLKGKIWLLHSNFEVLYLILHKSTRMHWNGKNLAIAL